MARWPKDQTDAGMKPNDGGKMARKGGRHGKLRLTAKRNIYIGAGDGHGREAALPDFNGMAIGPEAKKGEARRVSLASCLVFVVTS